MTAPVDPRGRDRRTAAASGAVRLAAAAGLLRFSSLTARLAGAPGDPVVVAGIQLLGLRDASLGVLALRAAATGGSARRQLTVQATADLVDAAILAAAIRAGRLPKLRGLAGVGVALGSAAGHVAVARRLPDLPVAAPRHRA